jgi:hypothetical protein
MQLSKIQITALLTEVASPEDGFNEILRMSFKPVLHPPGQAHHGWYSLEQNGWYSLSRIYTMAEIKTYYHNLALLERFSVALNLNPTEIKNNPKIKELLFSTSYATIAA